MIHNNRLKLCDFGCARVMPMDGVPLTDYVATRWYRPPELELRSRTYDFSVDCWSIGCIFGELVDGMPVFAGETTVDQLHLIQQTLGVLPKYPGTTKGVRSNVQHDYSKPKRTFQQRYRKKLSTEGLAMITSLLSLDPTKRLSADQCLRHNYFSNLKAVAKKVARKTKITGDAEEISDDDEVAEEIGEDSIADDFSTPVVPVANEEENDYADDFEEEAEPQAQAMATTASPYEDDFEQEAEPQAQATTTTTASPYEDDFEQEAEPQAQAATTTGAPLALNQLPQLQAVEKGRTGGTEGTGIEQVTQHRGLPEVKQADRQASNDSAGNDSAGRDSVVETPQIVTPRVRDDSPRRDGESSRVTSSASRAEESESTSLPSALPVSVPPVSALPVQPRAEGKRASDKVSAKAPQADPGERKARRTRKAGLQRRTQLGERTKKKNLKHRNGKAAVVAATPEDENVNMNKKQQPQQQQRKKKGK
jgi:hypothetical protein